MTGWTDLTSIGERFSQFILMAAMILGNQAIARRAQNHRVREEGRRIRYLLRGSMRALRDLYDDNLRLLASGDGLLLSGRSQITLLRIHFGRLVSLNEAEIEAMLTASIAMEVAETAMAVAGKPMGGVAVTLPREGGAAESVKLPLLRALAALETAEALLAPGGPPARQTTEEATLFRMAEAD
jgi:hypothetical protein